MTSILKRFGRFDLLSYMNGFWINFLAPNDEFWAHEFSKHATCTSTFDVACYSVRSKLGILESMLILNELLELHIGNGGR